MRARALQFYPGTFVAYTGYLRAGKTMAAFAAAAHLRMAGWSVVSNIPSVFSEHITTVEELLTVRQSVIVWDEIQASLSSREWASRLSRSLTEELILFGKRGNVILYAVPSFAMIDTRLRQLTQWLYVCARVQHHAQPASLRALYWYPGTGDLAFPAGRSVMLHRPHYGLYDTLYGSRPGEQLAFVARSGSPSVSVPPSREAKRAKGGNRCAL